MINTKVLHQIEEELDYARNKWGTAFDDKNTLNDWAAYINIYLGQAVKINTPLEQVTRHLRAVAGLAISALEAFERNGGSFPPRHYDKNSVVD